MIGQLEGGGKRHGSCVSYAGLLDRDLCRYVLRWGHDGSIRTILDSNSIFPYIRLLKIIRTDVYVFIRSLFNSIHGRLYMVF